MWKLAVLAGAIVSFAATDALAVSRAVRKACRADYLSFCSQHEVGSSALRGCMKKNRYKLSDGCTNALLESGEVGPKPWEQGYGQIAACIVGHEDPRHPRLR